MIRRATGLELASGPRPAILQRPARANRLAVAPSRTCPNCGEGLDGGAFCSTSCFLEHVQGARPESILAGFLGAAAASAVIWAAILYAAGFWR